MRRWDRLLDAYMAVCESRGLAEATLVGRRRELERWGCWLKNRRPRPKLEDVDMEMLVKYIKTRSHFRAKSTLYGVISHMRQFGDFFVAEGIWMQNVVRWIRGPKVNQRARLPRRIDRQTLKSLWEAAASSREEYYRYLWVAVLAVLSGTGLRRGELERLNISDWDRDSGLLKIDGRKVGQERKVPVPESVWQCIEIYLPVRQNKLEKNGRLEEQALFVNRDGNRLVGGLIGSAIGRLAKTANVHRVTAHQFRHTCASDLLENGAALPQVQKILGHASVSSTVRYLDIADPKRHEAMELHPVNEILEACYETIGRNL